MTHILSLPWKDLYTKNLKPLTPWEFRPYFPKPFPLNPQTIHLIATPILFTVEVFGLVWGLDSVWIPSPPESNRIPAQISTKQPKHKVIGLKKCSHINILMIQPTRGFCYKISQVTMEKLNQIT